MKRKLRTFLSMRDRRLLCEAVVTLVLARFVVSVVPFRRIAVVLAYRPDTNTCDRDLLLAVRRAITIASRHVPWNAVCLPQAIAAKTMLAIRGHGSSFHVGAEFDGSGKLFGHAWVTTRGIPVIGEQGISGVKPLARLG